MVTIKQLARMAGVSATTVSNVLHGREHKMNDGTLKKVKRVITETNYVPHMGGRLLGNHGSRIIGVIISWALRDKYNIIRGPFFSEIIGVMEHEIRKEGYFLMLYTSGSVEESIRMAGAWNVEGLIVLGCQMDECAAFLRSTGIPLVFIDSYFHDDGLPYVNVGLDDRPGGYCMTRYLIERGHRHIAYLADGYPQWGVYYERRCGCRDAMEEHHLSFGEEDYIALSANAEERAAIFRSLVGKPRKKYTALFFANDMFAAEAMYVFQDMGKRIPEDISICGFDGNVFSSLCRPQLATIKQDVPQKARCAVEQLMRLIRKLPLENRIVRLGVSLCPGASVQDINSPAKEI
jgi:LacI family transcriptional regulator